MARSNVQEEMAVLSRTALAVRAMLCHLAGAASFFVFALSTMGFSFLASGLAKPLGYDPVRASTAGAFLGVAVGFVLYGSVLRVVGQRSSCREGSRRPQWWFAGLLLVEGAASIWLCIAVGRPSTAWYPGLALWLSIYYSVNPDRYFRPLLVTGLLMFATTPLVAFSGNETGIGLMSLFYLAAGYRELRRALRPGLRGERG